MINYTVKQINKGISEEEYLDIECNSFEELADKLNEYVESLEYLIDKDESIYKGKGLTKCTDKIFPDLIKLFLNSSKGLILFSNDDETEYIMITVCEKSYGVSHKTND